jgi:regulator of sirC expression with transglutaminase-like and TPR domain
VRLFSLAAPYSKFDIELYEKRGLSYLQLGQYSDALADFDYYLIQDPNHALVLAAVESAKKAHSKLK